MRIFFFVLVGFITGIMIAYSILLFIEFVFLAWISQKRMAWRRHKLTQKFQAAEEIFSDEQMQEIYSKEELKAFKDEKFYG